MLRADLGWQTNDDVEAEIGSVTGPWEVLVLLIRPLSRSSIQDVPVMGSGSHLSRSC